MAKFVSVTAPSGTLKTKRIVRAFTAKVKVAYLLYF